MLSGRGPVLLVVAAPVEARAVLAALGAPPEGAERVWTPLPAAGRFEVVISGVGKSAAAGATARFLDPDRHAGVLSLGVAGALPGTGLELGSVVLGTRAVFADEGFETPDGFTDISTAGFPPGPEGGMGVTCRPELNTALAPLSDTSGVIATVSTCAGTDARAAEVAMRTGAVAEAMEGGAVGVSAARVCRGLWFSELRVISNTTGDRAGQRWDLALALERLAETAGRL